MARLQYLNGKPITQCTPAELRAAASESRRRSQESFERSDTDGFLSQWALDMTAQVYEAQARLLEQGGNVLVPVLVRGDEIVATRVHYFPDGFGGSVAKWRLPDALAAQLGRRWVPYGMRSRVQKQLGLRESEVRKTGVAVLDVPRGQQRTGLAGCANAIVRCIPLDEVD